MINIEMNEEQYNNLMLFIERVELTGREAPAYVDILQCLGAPARENKEEE